MKTPKSTLYGWLREVSLSPRVTGLPPEQFKKTTWMVSGASKGKRPAGRLPYGTLQIGVNDTEKFHHLLGMIEGVKKKMSVL